jgi:hypothetical protein
MRKGLVIAVGLWASWVSNALAEENVLNKGLSLLIGRQVQAATEVLGLPDRETTFSGNKVYVWETSRMEAAPELNVNFHSGYVGQTPMGWTSFDQSTTLHHAQCEIKLVVDQSNAIAEWYGKGSEAGCRDYARNMHVWLREMSERLDQGRQGTWFLRNQQVPEQDGGALWDARRGCYRAGKVAHASMTPAESNAFKSCMAAKGYRFVFASNGEGSQRGGLPFLDKLFGR